MMWSACHLYKFWTLQQSGWMSGQWEYLLSPAAIARSLQTVGLFFSFSFFSSTIWCYSSGIQSPSPNLSPRHHTLPHPLYSLMHTLKRTGGPRVGCGRGVGGCVRVTEGYIQPPYLKEVCGLWVWPSVDATVSSLSSHFHLSFLFSSWREPIMSYKLTGKIQRWML